jgi:hypothetical protein
MPLPAPLGPRRPGRASARPFSFLAGHGPRERGVNNLQQATEKICELKGGLLALDAVVTALITALPEPQRAEMAGAFAQYTEVARSVLLNAPISEHTISAYEHEVRRYGALLEPPAAAD